MNIKLKNTLLVALVTLFFSSQVESQETSVVAPAGLVGGAIATSGALDKLNTSNAKYTLSAQSIFDHSKVSGNLDKEIQQALDKISNKHMVHIETIHVENASNFEADSKAQLKNVKDGEIVLKKITNDFKKLLESPSDEKIKNEFDRQYGKGAAKAALKEGDQFYLLRRAKESLELSRNAYNQIIYDGYVYGKNPIVESSHVIDPTKVQNTQEAVKKILQNAKGSNRQILSIGITEVATNGTKKILFGGAIAGAALTSVAFKSLLEALNQEIETTTSATDRRTSKAY